MGQLLETRQPVGIIEMSGAGADIIVLASENDDTIAFCEPTTAGNASFVDRDGDQTLIVTQSPDYIAGRMDEPLRLTVHVGKTTQRLAAMAITTTGNGSIFVQGTPETQMHVRTMILQAAEGRINLNSTAVGEELSIRHHGTALVTGQVALANGAVLQVNGERCDDALLPDLQITRGNPSQ